MAQIWYGGEWVDESTVPKSQGGTGKEPSNQSGDNNTGAPPSPKPGDVVGSGAGIWRDGQWVQPPDPIVAPPPTPQTASITDRANQPNTVPATPKPADLSRYGQAQTGNFPNSFVNLQAYLNANPTPPSYMQQQAPGNYTQGQSNLDQTMRGAYYGPQAMGQSGLPMWGAPGFPSTPNAAQNTQGAGAAQPAAQAPPGAASPSLASSSLSSPVGATPQPGVANQAGAMTGGQNQSVQNMAPGTTYGSPTEKDRPFPRLQKYLG
jgi:hypothetical protein